LLDLPHAAERLKLFPADLTVPGSFMQALEGCKYVIHTASPYALEVPPGQVGNVHAHQGLVNPLRQPNKQQAKQPAQQLNLGEFNPGAATRIRFA
jgi:hypothetical protein